MSESRKAMDEARKLLVESKGYSRKRTYLVERGLKRNFGQDRMVPSDVRAYKANHERIFGK